MHYERVSCNYCGKEPDPGDNPVRIILYKNLGEYYMKIEGYQQDTPQVIAKGNHPHDAFHNLLHEFSDRLFEDWQAGKITDAQADLYNSGEPCILSEPDLGFEICCPDCNEFLTQANEFGKN